MAIPHQVMRQSQDRMVHRCCQFQYLAVEYQTDEAFLLQCVKKQLECWLSFPDHLKNDIRFALSFDSLDQIKMTDEKEYCHADLNFLHGL